MKKNVKFSVIGLMSIGLLLGACKNDDDDTAACTAPSGLVTDATSANSITISWSANGGSAWTIEYGETGFTPGSGATMTSASSSATIANLEDNTTYDFYVQNNCGDENKKYLRIVTQNINGLGQMQNSLKELNLKHFASNYGVDILGIQETNVCWNKVGQKNAIWDRF